MKNIKHPLIYIEWCDAIEGAHGWMSKDEAIEWSLNSDWIISQTSFLIKETKEYLLLASKINEEEDNQPKVSGLMKIPKTWIKKRQNLSEFISY